MTIHDLWIFASFLVSAGAVYGGIRKDLERIHEKIEAIHHAVEKAHSRIDGLGAGRRAPRLRAGDGDGPY